MCSTYLKSVNRERSNINCKVHLGARTRQLYFDAMSFYVFYACLCSKLLNNYKGKKLSGLYVFIIVNIGYLDHELCS